MPTSLSRFLAILVALLLAAGAIVATPLAAGAATDSSVTITTVDENGDVLTGTSEYQYYYYEPSTGAFDPIYAHAEESAPGTFVVDGISGTRYLYAEFSKPGYSTYGDVIYLTSGDHSVTLQKLTISGHVTDEDSAAIASGTVELYSESDLTTPVTTAPIVDGSYLLQAPSTGNYFVRFTADGHETVLNDGQPDDLAQASSLYVSGPTTANAVLTKIKSYTLTGSYTQNYYGFTGRVFFERFDGDAFVAAGSAALDGSSDASYSTTLQAGYYRVTAYIPGFKTSKRYVTITDHDASIAPVVVAYGSAYAHIYVSAPHADPSSSISISLYEQVTPGNWQPVSTKTTPNTSDIYVTTTAADTYRVVLSDPSGTYRNRAIGNNESHTDDVSPNDVAGLGSSYDFRGYTYFSTDQGNLQEHDAVSIGSFEYFGKPVAGATVTFWSKTDGFDAVKKTVSDENGHYEAYLPAGTYSVSATADGYSDVSFDTDATVTFGDGDFADFGTREFTHKDNPTIGGLVTDQFGAPYSGTVTLQQQTDDEWADADTQQTGTDGGYSFAVTDGTYRVLAGGQTSASYVVEPSKTVATIVVTDPDATPPTDVADLPSLADAKVGQAESVPGIAWADGWATSSVKWYLDDSTDPISTDASYTPAFADLGKSLSAVVTGSKGDFTYDVTLAGTTIGSNTFATSDVVIDGLDEGETYVGDVLTADGNWGTDGVSETLWNWTIDGTTVSTSNTYTVTEADLTKTIVVSVHGEKDGYAPADHTVTVTVPKGDVDIQVSTTGDGTIGSTLIASTENVPSTIPVTYTWHSEYDGDNLVDTGASHVVTAADFSGGIFVTATTEETNLYLPSESSAYPQLNNSAIPDSTTVSVTGTVAEGDTLSAAIDGAPAGATFSYRWYGADGYSYDPTYVVTAADLGTDLRLRVRVNAPGYNQKTVNVYTHITGLTQTTGSASITGTPAVGEMLEGSASDWITPDPESVDLDYGWFVDGVQVESGDEYQVQPSDRGKTIVFRATGYASGYDPGVAEASVSVPLDTFVAGTPTMTGTDAVGSILTATTGTWPAGVHLDTQWLRNGVELAGETGLTRTVVAADQGANLTFRVTASRPNYATQIVAVTAAIPAAPVVTVDPVTLTPVPAAPVVVEKIVTVTQTVTVHTFGATPAPKVSGKAKVGKTLTAKATWTPGASFTYRWFANGKAISGATKSTLKLAASVKGKKITVQVTGTKSGYQTASATSKATAKVAK